MSSLLPEVACSKQEANYVPSRDEQDTSLDQQPHEAEDVQLKSGLATQVVEKVESEKSPDAGIQNLPSNPITETLPLQYSTPVALEMTNEDSDSDADEHSWFRQSRLVSRSPASPSQMLGEKELLTPSHGSCSASADLPRTESEHSSAPMTNSKYLGQLLPETEDLQPMVDSAVKVSLTTPSSDLVPSDDLSEISMETRIDAISGQPALQCPSALTDDSKVEDSDSDIDEQSWFRHSRLVSRSPVSSPQATVGKSQLTPSLAGCNTVAATPETYPRPSSALATRTICLGPQPLHSSHTANGYPSICQHQRKDKQLLSTCKNQPLEVQVAEGAGSKTCEIGLDTVDSDSSEDWFQV